MHIAYVAAILMVAIAASVYAGILTRALDRGLEACDNLLARMARYPFLVALSFLLPAVAILSAFTFFPFLYAIYISLFDTRRGLFIGAGNYVRAWHDPEFWRSVKVTCYYAAGTVPTTLLFSFAIAWSLFRIARARGFFRTVYFLPYVTSAVAAATVWRVLLRPGTGFINVLLFHLGVPQQQWLIEPRGILHILSAGHIPAGVGPSMALCCIMAFDIWHASGFMIVVFLAGLTAIPPQLEESARIDGASTWQVVRRVTLPLLSPTILFLVTVAAIKSFQSFNSFYALVNARNEDTQNLIVYIYAQFYENQRAGYGAAVAVIMCAAVIAITIVQWRFVGRKVHYE